nr:NAD(P)H-dependent oxidoreductase [Actinomycetota bacterium]
ATTAMALLGDDTTDMAAYTDERMGAGELVALRDRVRVVPEEGRAGTRSKVVVVTTSGERLEAEDDTGRPATDLLLQQERLTAKFLGLAAPVLGAERAAALRDAVASIEASAGVRPLCRLVRV